MKRLSLVSALIACVALFASCATAPSVEIVPLRDNAQPRLMDASLFADTAPAGAIEQLGLQDGVPASVCAFLAKVGDEHILFDGGNGTADSQMLPAMMAAGVTPADIDYIMITHVHGDHIGGLTKDGKAVFENATMYLPKSEYDGWIAMGEERSAQMRAMLAAYGDRVEIFADGAALPCGVEPILAVGHTPGHTIYRIGSNVIAGDIMHGVALQMVYPEACARFDMNQDDAVASRKSVVEQAKQEHLTLYGMHFPEPYYLEF